MPRQIHRIALASFFLTHLALAEDTPQIPAVASMKELRALKPLKLRDDMTARIGIDTARAPESSCVMVYALIENYDNSIADGGDPLGPLTISVKKQDEAPRDIRRGLTPRQRLKTPEVALFVRSIPLEEAGKRSVAVKFQERLLGAATIDVLPRGDFHPWARLDREKAFVNNARTPNSLAYSGAGLAFPLFNGDIGHQTDVLPTLDGGGEATMPAELAGAFRKKIAEAVEKFSSEDFDEREAASAKLRDLGAEALPLLKEALPNVNDAEAKRRLQIMIEQYSRQMKLRAEQGDLIVDLPFDIQINFPQDSFLVRWWVNGQPYLPPATEAIPARASRGAVHNAGRSIRMNIELDYTKMRIKPGDTIGAQVMFCPYGVSEMKLNLNVPSRDLMALRLRGEPPPWLLGVSNRVEFKAK